MLIIHIHQQFCESSSHLYNMISTILTDGGTFVGAPFPANFRDVVKTIFKRLFRVYAHIYHSHFQKIVSLKEEAHLNTCFKHFILFTYVSSLLLWFLLLTSHRYSPSSKVYINRIGIASIYGSLEAILVYSSLA